MADNKQTPEEESTRVAIINAPAAYRSKIWKHFGFPPSNDNPKQADRTKTICKICFTEVSYKTGTTTNMRTHIIRKHNINIDEDREDTSTRPTAGVNTNKTTQSDGQLKLSHFLNQKYSRTSQRHLNITTAIGMFIAKDLRPYSVVENEGFRNLLTVIDPRYEVPSRTHFATSVLPKMYHTVKDKVVSDLKTATAISLTTDGWTSLATEGYNTVTAHYIDGGWKMQSYTLQTRKMDLSHTGVNLSEMLTYAIEEWDLKRYGFNPAISTDNASNVVNSVKLANMEIHVRCFAHTLNLATQKGLKITELDKILAKIRRIVGYFHRSNVATTSLKAKQLLLELPQHKLIMDVSTRWNSTYDLLARYIEQHDAIEAVLLNKEIKKLSKELLALNNDEMICAQSVMQVLEPIKTVTTIMCSESSPTCSLIHPLHSLLLKQLQENDHDNAIVKELKNKIKTDLEHRYIC